MVVQVRAHNLLNAVRVAMRSVDVESKFVSVERVEV